MISILSTAWTLFFPFSLLLIVYPVDFFIRNQVELQSDIALLNSILISAAVVGGICLFGAFLSSVTNKRLQWSLASAGLYLGLYIVAGDLVAPLAIDKHIGFDGTESILQPPTVQIILDIAVFLVCIFLFLRFRGPEQVKIGAAFAFVFLAINVGSSVQQIQALAPVGEGFQSDERWKIKEPPPANPADHPNVYHIVLDGFQGGVLPEAMKLADLTAKDLNGFIYYPKNRSNYDGTQMSFPSFMTGTIYRNGNMKDWYFAWFETGMWNKIKEKISTSIQIYSAHKGYVNTPYNLERKLDIASKGQKRAIEIVDIIFHMSLVRVAPSYLHQYIFKDGRGIFPLYEAVGARPELDPRLEPLRFMIDDEYERSPRGQYVFSHIFVPHSPYYLDENCVSTRRPNTEFTKYQYVEQSGCALRYVDEFLDTLRRLGRYEEATIIIHADHGWLAGDPIEPLSGSEEEARIAELDLTERVPRGAHDLDTWTAALLMVKPPGQSGAPMVTSPRSTQLIDLPNTIYDIL